MARGSDKTCGGRPGNIVRSGDRLPGQRTPMAYLGAWNWDGVSECQRPIDAATMDCSRSSALSGGSRSLEW